MASNDDMTLAVHERRSRHYVTEGEAILDFIQLSLAELKTIERSHRSISRTSL